MNLERSRVVRAVCYAAAIGSAALVTPVRAERIQNGVAVFSALDKVTARISKFEVGLGESAKFGALTVTPRVCYSRPPTEEPKTTSFVEVDEQGLDGSQKRIFTGWMFAESPGLYGVEHPTYDVWLTGCRKPVGASAAAAPGGEAGDSSKAKTTRLPSKDELFETRRRLRR